MNKLSKGLVLVLSMVLIICFVTVIPALGEERKVIMKISGSGATVKGNQTAESFKMFEHLAELYSDGEIDVKIFPAGTFGGSQEAVLSVRNGECHMFNLASNNFAVHSPSIWPFSFPYMFNSFNQIRRLVDSPFGEKIQQRVLEESGVRVAGYAYSGWRVISNSVRPIKTLEDLKGLKVRVPKSPTIIETFKAWNVNPTPIAWEETFTALQQGVCDGFDNPVNVIGSFGFYEVQDYVTSLKYQPQFCVYIMNEQFWQGLSPKHRAAVQRAIDESTRWCTSYVEWAEDKYTEVCKKNGMEFYTLPAAEEARWEEKARAIWPRLAELTDMEWVKEIEANLQLLN